MNELTPETLETLARDAEQNSYITDDIAKGIEAHCRKWRNDRAGITLLQETLVFLFDHMGNNLPADVCSIVDQCRVAIAFASEENQDS